MEDRVTPTVIVARSPLPGHEREFERWMKRITDEASRMKGHVGSELQPPGPTHPDEWVIVYQFEDQQCLDAWIESPVRADLLAEGAALTHGDARVQQLAMGAGADPVTAVASFRILPGRENEFQQGYRELVDALETFDGYLRAQLFPPVDGVQDETIIVFSFDSRAQLDVWLDSDVRNDGLGQLNKHIDGERQVNVIGGFGGWFQLGERSVKTWKQASVVLLALYPTVLLLNEVLGWLIPDVPYVLAILIGNVISVAVLSWVLMPRLTNFFSNWLRR